MLVLSRKVGEVIQIDDSITITLIELRGGRARIGVNAPRNMQILRKELIDFEPSQKAEELQPA